MLAGNDKDLRAKALDAANKPPVVSAPPKSEPSSFTPSVSSSSGFGVPTSSGLGSSFNAAPAPVTGFGGKLAPPEAPQPLL
jgi:hypothetical protein